jgi:purine-nucleoside phosphorylase
MIAKHLAKVEKLTGFLLKKTGGFEPEIALIMGSGLGSAAVVLKNTIEIPYSSVAGFMTATVRGHRGRFLFGTYGRKKVVIMQGRFHYYEGYSMADIAAVIRTLAGIGVKNLIISASVGSMYKDMPKGSLFIVKDHINLMGDNPLRGIYHKSFGAMFPGMENAYDRNFRKLALKICRRLKIHAKEGVYFAVPGPSYETPAEIKAFRKLGGDMVGMSTVPEVIPARALGMRVLSFAWVTNFACGISPKPLKHDEILKQGDRMVVRFKKLLSCILKEM